MPSTDCWGCNIREIYDKCHEFLPVVDFDASELDETLFRAAVGNGSQPVVFPSAAASAPFVKNFTLKELMTAGEEDAKNLQGRRYAVQSAVNGIVESSSGHFSCKSMSLQKF